MIAVTISCCKTSELGFGAHRHRSGLSMILSKIIRLESPSFSSFVLSFVYKDTVKSNPRFRRLLGTFGKMEGKKRIAVCQMTSTENKDKNMNVVANLVKEAAKDNAQMVFLPEACDYLCDNKKDTINFAEPIIGGKTVAQYRELAKTNNVWLSLGGLHEKDAKNEGKIFNTHIIIDNDGDIVQTYRKLHLFDVEIPEKNIRLKESDLASAGSHIVFPVDSPVGKIGMAICYDMRFPELAAQLSKFGADILTYPSAFTYATGKAHWDLLLRCRAVENQCFVIAAAQIGDHNRKRKSYGHAMCVDAWGEIIATCGDNSNEPCYAIAELDYSRLDEVRRNMPVFEHRRNDVYTILNQSVRKIQIDEHVTNARSPKDVHMDRESPVEEVELGEPYHLFSTIKVRASTVFYETELSYAFVNIRCVVPGHVLVAPKRVAKRLNDLTYEEICDFFQTVVKVQNVMERVHKTSSSTVTVQDGPDAGQTVEHVHCHVMPRHSGDFKDVDLIYLELAKHDARPGRPKVSMPLKPPRDLSDMRLEAELLKSYFKKD